MKNQLTLLHFANPDDLLAGIDILREHKIIIQEIYTPKRVPGIETRLNMRQLRFGESVIRLGCLGGVVLTSLGFYLLQPSGNWKTALINTAALLATLFIAGCLSPVKSPRLFTLKPGDRRYLAVVDTKHVGVNESIAHLFQYADAVDFSSAIKNIVIS